MQINFKPEEGCCEYQAFGEMQFTFGEEWTKFSVTTPVMPRLVDLGSITFHVAFGPGVFWMDDIQFTEVEVPAPAGDNLLVNGGFEDAGLEPWFLYNNTDVLVTATVVDELVGANIEEEPVEGTYALEIEVPEAGVNFWDSGMGQTVAFTGGTIYTLSAFLKSKEGEMTINFKPEEGVAPYQGFGEQQFTFGEEWTEFSVTTPIMPRTVDPASTTFHLAFGPGIFWIDDVQLRAAEVTLPPGEDILVNGGFEDVILDPWTTYGEVNTTVVRELVGASVPAEPPQGAYALEIEVPAAGVNLSDAGLQQAVSLRQGEIYTLSAFVKAQEGDMQINFKVEENCCAFEGFAEQQFTIGEEWTELNLTTPPRPHLQARRFQWQRRFGYWGSDPQSGASVPRRCGFVSGCPGL